MAKISLLLYSRTVIKFHAQKVSSMEFLLTGGVICMKNCPKCYAKLLSRNFIEFLLLPLMLSTAPYKYTCFQAVQFFKLVPSLMLQIRDSGLGNSPEISGLGTFGMSDLVPGRHAKIPGPGTLKMLVHI